MAITAVAASKPVTVRPPTLLRLPVRWIRPHQPILQGEEVEGDVDNTDGLYGDRFYANADRSRFLPFELGGPRADGPVPADSGFSYPRQRPSVPPLLQPANHAEIGIEGAGDVRQPFPGIPALFFLNCERDHTLVPGVTDIGDSHSPANGGTSNDQDEVVRDCRRPDSYWGGRLG